MIVKRQNVNAMPYLPGIVKGMIFTLKRFFINLFFPKERVTLNYPEEYYKYGPRFKGNHILTVKKDGSLRCTACMLCATNCPAHCIKITASESDDKEVEKYPISYEIDMLRCVFCGFCEEACPVDAIRMGPQWQTPGLSGDNFVYDIKHLAYRKELGSGVQSLVDDKERIKAGL